MAVQPETDFPQGHPGRGDWNPRTREAQEWARQNVHPLGERDFPVDHPKAADTPGNLNAVEVHAGEDPLNPHREAFTGRTPEQVAAIRELSAAASEYAEPSPAARPVDAVEVNTALNAMREKLGRDLLTPEEYSKVLARFHR